MKTTPPKDGRRASESVYRRIARNSLLFASGTAASAVLTMIAVALAARALPPKDFGVFVLLQSTVLMLQSVTSFSTQQPVIKLGSQALAREDRDALGSIVSMGLMVDIAAAVLSSVVAVALLLFAGQRVGLTPDAARAALIVCAALLFTGYPTSNGIFRLYDRFALGSIAQTATAAGLLAAFALLFAAGASVRAFLIAWAAYLAINSTVQLGVAIRLLHRDGVRLRFRASHFTNEDGRTLLHYSWTTWGTSTLDTIRTNGDSLLVGAVVSVEAAGVYNVARQLAGIVRKFNVVYASTVFPEIARIAADDDAIAARRLKQRTFWTSLAFAAAVTASATVFGKMLIALIFGARFEAGYAAFVLLAAAAAAQLISHTPSMYVQIYRGPRILFVLYAVATFAFLATAPLLTAKLSIIGTAAAQLIFAVLLTLCCEMALRGRGALRSAPNREGASRYRARSR